MVNDRLAALENVRQSIELVMSDLAEGANGKQYDSSWTCPRTLSREDVARRCEQAYHWAKRALDALAALSSTAPALSAVAVAWTISEIGM